MGDVDYFLGSQGVEFPGRKSLHVSKIVMDPIQGLIKLDGTFAQIVDTPQFQRLRDLKQLGSAYFIFPGASHNRFEHSLGVAHLSKLWANKFRVDQPGLGVTERQVDLVGLAGLCHDLGHGPFSHVFDNEFIPAVRPHSTWKHEQMSVKLLEHCVDQNHIDLDKEDLQYIGDLIMGDGPSKQRKGRCAFLFDIVNNSRNSVDVDKFDYLQRDAYNVGIKSTYDSGRLLQYSRVVADEICFHAKESFNVYELFHTRYSLFKQVYTHRVGKAVEYMLCDAMKAADSTLRISESIDDAEAYSHMTDSIIMEIERSRDPALQESQAILKRLRLRDLYKIVGDRLLSPEQALHAIKAATAENIASCADASHPLRPQDLIVHQCRINYAMKDKNPVDSVGFYNGKDDTAPFHLPKSKVSLMIPDVFEEKYLRLYVRDASKMEAAKLAWDSFLLREHYVDPTAESSQTQLLKASPARPPKAGRPPVAPALSSTRGDLFQAKEDAAKKKAKVDLVANPKALTLDSFFGSK